MKKLRLTLHPVFIILGAVLVMMGNSATFFVCTLSALLHELGHAIVASRYGYKMQKIRLMPFGAELHGDTDCFDGLDELYIAIAGPCVNFAVVIITLGLWWIKPEIYEYTHLIFETNLVMGLFNLLPLFPLDGGRVVLSLMSRKLSRSMSARIVKNITKLSSIVLFVCFLLTIISGINLSLGIVAFLLFFTASSSAKDAVYQKISLLSLVNSKGVWWANVSVPSGFRVYELSRFHIKNRVLIFMVLNDDGREVFRFSELDLERIRGQISSTMSVLELKKYLR